MSAEPATHEGGEPQAVADQVSGFKVFAGNLAYSTTDDGLKTFFEPVASDITSVQVIFRGPRPAGYGFVGFTTEEAANKAVELLDKKELDGRTLIIELAKPADEKERRVRKPKARTSRRGSKAPQGEVTEAEAEGGAADKTDTAADAATGDAQKPKKKKKSTRKPKSKSAEGEGESGAADAAAPAEGNGEAADGERKPRGRKPRVPRPPRRPAGEDPVGEPSANMLFVANLGFNVDDTQLETMFKDADVNVRSARIVRRRFGTPRRSKGYGFVDVGDQAEQTKAIQALDGKEINGRAIAVKIAVNSQIADNADETPATILDAPEA